MHEGGYETHFLVENGQEIALKTPFLAQAGRGFCLIWVMILAFIFSFLEACSAKRGLHLPKSLHLCHLIEN
ncbi:hypothetical protein ACVWVT_002935 [Ewingella americana]